MVKSAKKRSYRNNAVYIVCMRGWIIIRGLCSKFKLKIYLLSERKRNETFKKTYKQTNKGQIWWQSVGSFETQRATIESGKKKDTVTGVTLYSFRVSFGVWFIYNDSFVWLRSCV